MAFSFCESLTAVTLPKATDIGELTFSDNPNLKYAYVADKNAIAYFNDYSFYQADVIASENGNIVINELEPVSDCVSMVKEGTPLTVTITPDKGYRLASLKYSDGTTETEIIKTEDAYTFIMPETDITVSAEFEKIIEIQGETKVSHTDIKTYTAVLNAEMPEGSYIVWEVTGGTFSYIGEHLGTDSITIICEDIGTLKVEATVIDAYGAPVVDEKGNIISDSMEVTVQSESGTVINMIIKVLRIISKLFSGLKKLK